MHATERFQLNPIKQYIFQESGTKSLDTLPHDFISFVCFYNYIVFLRATVPNGSAQVWDSLFELQVSKRVYCKLGAAASSALWFHSRLEQTPGRTRCLVSICQVFLMRWAALRVVFRSMAQDALPWGSWGPHLPDVRDPFP